MEKLNSHSVIRPHSRKIITEAEKIKEKIKEWLFLDEAPQRKLIEWITIDWESSKDLDDWLWAEKTSFWYSLFISIADASEYIKTWSSLDKYCLKRPSSIYLNTHSYHMLPEILSTDILSLNHKKRSLTQTLEINFDNDFNIIWINSFESIFYNKSRLSYNNFEKYFNNPENDLYDNLQILYLISQALKQKRIKSWSNPNFRECISIKLDKECKQNTIKNIWQQIVSEIMILKNNLDAIYAYKQNFPILFRWFKPELKWRIPFKIKNNDRWFYSFIPTYHSWFNTQFYTHTTSPIRRYADLINQRQIKSYNREKLPFYTNKQIRELAIYINWQIEQIIEQTKAHNNEVIEKRTKRLLKKLEDNNFENLWSLSQRQFFYLIKYFISNSPYYLNFEKIIEELIYRINNDLLDKKSISIIKSAPKNIEEIIFFKELLKQKEEQNLLY